MHKLSRGIVWTPGTPNASWNGAVGYPSSISGTWLYGSQEPFPPRFTLVAAETPCPDPAILQSPMMVADRLEFLGLT